MPITISDPFLVNAIEAAIKTGGYQNISELIFDSLEALIREKTQLAIDVGCQMYQEGKISLGRACELADVDMESMKAELRRREILRTSDLTSQEQEEAVHREVMRYRQSQSQQQEEQTN